MRALGRSIWGLVGLVGLGFAWEWGHLALGPFFLPSPLEAAGALLRMFASGEAETALGSTSAQALGGWALGGLLGFALALAGSLTARAEAMLRPVATVLMGVPPVAWLALALLWLGPGGPTPAFTVAVTILPVIFIAALHGFASRDPLLDELADLFGAPRRQRLTDILLPQLLDQLLPALATALGLAWKVCVMSEVMSSGTGIGGRLATARAHLDLPETMAWVLLVTLLVLICDFALIAPLRNWLTQSREPLAAAT